MQSISLALAAVAIVALTMALTTWFCLRTFLFLARQENQNFRLVSSRYETLLKAADEERRAAKILLDVVEALNLNTKSIAKLETTNNQLVLRSIGYQDRTKERQKQVGEETTTTRVGPVTIVGAAPRSRNEQGEEGFVDATTLEVVPDKKPTAREIAAMPPT